MPRPRYRKKVLEIPSLRQGNKNNKKSGVWCGRTSASMIYNYYEAVRGGTNFIINNEDDPNQPYDLVLNGKKALDYGLADFVRQAFPPADAWLHTDHHPDGSGPITATGAPVGKENRPAEVSEDFAVTALEKILESLDNNNPVLVYTGIAADVRWPRHIMVISGYKVAPDGRLWLQFDDPGGEGETTKHGRAVGDEGFEPQKVSDKHVQQPEHHGRRFWFRAGRLFGRNDVSAPTDDRYCDYYDHDRKLIRRLLATVNTTIVAPPKFAWSESWLGAPYEGGDKELGTDIEELWRQVALADSLYPMGANRTWHTAVHIGRAEKTAAWCFAPGQLIEVRQAKEHHEDEERRPLPEPSYVLVRHFFAPKTFDVVDPAGVAKLEEQGEPVEIFYSLYMHLEAPLDAKRGGAWVERLSEPPDEVKPRKWVPEHHPCALVMRVTDGSADTDKRFDARGVRSFAEYDCPDEPAPNQRVVVRGPHGYTVPVDPAHNNSGPWSQPQSVPVGVRPLAFFNPATEKVIETTIRTKRTTRAQLRSHTVKLKVLAEAPGGGAWIAVSVDPMYRPGFEIGNLLLESSTPHNTPAPLLMPPLSPGELVRIKDPSATLFLRTKGSGDRRYFPELKADMVELTTDLWFRIAEIWPVATKTRRKPRMWPQLEPCVLIDKEERAHLEQILDGQRAKLAVKARLDRGESMLFGITVGKVGDWSINETTGTVQPKDPAKARMHAALRGDGSFAMRRLAPQDAAPPGVCFLLDVGEDDRFPYVGTYTARGVACALLEGRLVVDAPVDNRDAVEKYQEAVALWKKARQRIDDAIDSGAATRFDDLGPRSHLGREKLGDMGHFSPGRSGFHFEIFAGKDILTNSEWRQDWRVIDDIPADDLISTDFIRAIADKIVDAGIGRSGYAARSLLEAKRTGVLTQDEWRAFHDYPNQSGRRPTHARALANFVCKHPPEWAVDWDAHLGLVDRVKHGRVAPHTSELRIWKEGLRLDGIDGDPFYYHPVRFIEWLTTGINARFINNAAVDRPPGSLKLRIRDANGRRKEVELPASPKADDPLAAYRYRTITGIVSDEVIADIDLAGAVATANPELMIRIESGAMQEVWIAHPEAKIELLADATDLVGYSVPVVHTWRYRERRGDDAPDKSYLLPVDPNNPLHFPDHGYSKVVVQISCKYNHSLPSEIKLDLSSGLEFVSYTLTGAQWKDSAKPEAERDKLPNQATIEPERIGKPPRFFTSYDTVSLIVSLRALQWDRKGTLRIDVSGGDLTKPVTETLHIVTRKELKVKDGGEDVAKVQLYLSQILCGDGPCYRFSGTVDEKYPKGQEPEEASRGGKKPKKIKSRKVIRERSAAWDKSVRLTGHYSDARTKSPPPLATALWRFIATYASHDDWQLTEVRHTDASGGDPQSLKLRGTAGAVVAESIAFATARALEATSEDAVPRCPIVDEALLAEIVKRFVPPHAAMTLSLDVDPMNLPATATEVTDPKAKSYMLPGIEDEIALICKGLTGDMDIELTIGDNAAYYFPADSDWDDTLEVKTKLSYLADTGVKLKCFSNVNTDAKQNVVHVTTQGVEIGRLELGGVRDLHGNVKGLGRDAALLQDWLSKLDRADGKGKCYEGVVDGRWFRPKNKKPKVQGRNALREAERVLEKEANRQLSYRRLIAALKAKVS